jgi:hypothetical protein
MGTDWKRLSFFGVAFSAGIVGFLFGQPLIHGNDLAVNVIVTVFSILAGFLVAIMTIMGEPGAIASRSWRASEKNRTNVFNRLVRQKWMFYLYLTTLGLILIASLIGKQYPLAGLWIERIYLGAAITTFILSLGLPSALMKIQIARQDEIINSKRKAAGIKD